MLIFYQLAQLMIPDQLSNTTLLSLIHTLVFTTLVIKVLFRVQFASALPGQITSRFPILFVVEQSATLSTLTQGIEHLLRCKLERTVLR